jgi:hypothetical protein
MKRLFINWIPFFLLTGLLCQGKDVLDTWTWRNPLPTGDNLTGVAYGDGTFVAVGEFGTALVTRDGKNWQQDDSGVLDNLSGVAWGNHRFVAVGDSATIVVSFNGFAWVQADAPGAANDFTAVVYGKGKFVAVGRLGQTYFSADGLHWSGLALKKRTEKSSHLVSCL